MGVNEIQLEVVLGSHCSLIKIARPAGKIEGMSDTQVGNCNNSAEASPHTTRSECRSPQTHGPRVVSPDNGNNLSTPTPTATRRYHNTTCCDELCSICLSPLNQQASDAKVAIDFGVETVFASAATGDAPATTTTLARAMTHGQDKARVVTKCRHLFHKACLDQAKARKAECPMCRAALTPIAPSIVSISPAVIRETIVSNASRVRYNMQLAAARRRLQAEA